MLLYYITGRTHFPGNELQRRAALRERISAAAKCGIDFIQLREKDLSGRELELLAREAIRAVRAASRQTRLLVNSRTDIALAVGADGVHLRSNDISPSEARNIWQAAGTALAPVMAVSCHTKEDVQRAATSRADFAAFGPVFGKGTTPATGLDLLRSVSRCGIRVLALGGVNLDNAATCLEAGAAGVAGIRLFQNGNIAETVAKLRSLEKQG